MRNLIGTPEIASEASLPSFGPEEGLSLCAEGSSSMLHKFIPASLATEWPCAPGSRSLWAHYPEWLMRHPEAESRLRSGYLQEEPVPFAIPGAPGTIELGEKKVAAFNEGHALFQELFFFCKVKNVGDVPGTGCIYVETVVDRDSGVAFAKVYSTKNAMNAVDILASRVVPFFKYRGVAIKEIHTRKTNEYCGLPPVHPFETYLAASHIQHLPMELPGQPYSYRCQQFFRLLQKDFFLPALRRKFQLSLDDLQKGLDTFVEAYNALQMKHENELHNAPHPSANFPVDL
jgi:hypothetical protein